VQEFPKGKNIYDWTTRNTYLYVVLSGHVKISSTSETDQHIATRIVGAEGFFGESCLVNLNSKESATALSRTTVMAWSRNEVENRIESYPPLGFALLKYVVEECLALQDRLESLASLKTEARVMVTLLQLANELAVTEADGAVRLVSLTHRTIAEFAGTTREIITFEMNRLRRMGLIQYSRKFIEINTEAMVETLRAEGISIPEGRR
jgi:CRP/FNR family transcriptional regulator, cyclic AMP receptor protein